MKIFLISSSYIEMSMAEVLDAFFNEKIEKLFLLYENHPKRKYHFHNSDYSVEFVKNIEEGIKKSDIILVVKDSAVSPNFVYNLNKKCIQYGKLLLNGAIIKRRCTDFHDKYKDIIDNVPNVFIIEVNEAGQLIRNEKLLVKALEQKGVNILSNNQYLLKLDKDVHFLHTRESNNTQNVDIVFHSIGKYEYFSNMRIEYFNLINNIKPDFLIVCLDNSIIEYEEIERHFYYNYNLKVDLFIKSNYTLFKSNNKLNRVYCEKKENTNNSDYIFYNDCECFDKIAQEIIQKLAYPTNVIPIN